jgi:hypothetical protein
MRRIAIALLAAALSGCGDGDRFTLYRNSKLDPNMRLHVATFDTADGASYNRENCDLAAKLFQGQEGVTTRFWCEKGAYRK